MNFKNVKDINKILSKYPYIVSSSITLTGINYKVTPLSLYKSNNDIVFTFNSNEYEEDLNKFVESKLSQYTTMDEDDIYKYQIIFNNDYVIQLFDNVACFKEKGIFSIVEISNKDLTINFVLSSKQTFLNNLTLKSTFKGSLAKETLLYLMFKNLLGNLARIHVDSKYSVIDTVISPSDGLCLVDNITDNFTLAYLFTQLMIPKDYIDKATVSVSYLNLEKSLAYLIEFDCGDCSYSFSYLPM